MFLGSTAHGKSTYCRFEEHRLCTVPAPGLLVTFNSSSVRHWINNVWWLRKTTMLPRHCYTPGKGQFTPRRWPTTLPSGSLWALLSIPLNTETDQFRAGNKLFEIFRDYQHLFKKPNKHTQTYYNISLSTSEVIWEVISSLTWVPQARSSATRPGLQHPHTSYTFLFRTLVPLIYLESMNLGEKKENIL